MKNRYPTRQISVGSVKIGGGAPISVQSMSFSKTKNVEGTLEQINRLYFAGCDIVRCAVLDKSDADALARIKKSSPLPIVADIHFNFRLALQVAEFVDAIRINPGNIGGKDRIKEVVRACKARSLPIRIGVNLGSLEEQFEQKYGRSVEAMVQSALYNAALLQDEDFSDIAISLKTSDAPSTVAAYRALRPLCEYPFHLGVTEAGTKFHASIKSAIALGTLLMEGIGDTMRVSITGELEEEIRVARAILQDIKTPLNISVMGCVVNAIGEAKGADVAIAFGNGRGIVMRHGEVVAKLDESKLVERFLQEVEDEVRAREGA